MNLYLALAIEVGPDQIVHEIRMKVNQQSTEELMGQAVGALQPTGSVKLEKGEAATFSLVIPFDPGSAAWAWGVRHPRFGKRSRVSDSDGVCQEGAPRGKLPTDPTATWSTTNSQSPAEKSSKPGHLSHAQLVPLR